MFTNKEILNIAMNQSAIELSVSPADFLKKQNIITKASARNAIRSGFIPSWVEISIKSINIINNLNT